MGLFLKANVTIAQGKRDIPGYEAISYVVEACDLNDNVFRIGASCWKPKREDQDDIRDLVTDMCGFGNEVYMTGFLKFDDYGIKLNILSVADENDQVDGVQVDGVCKIIEGPMWKDDKAFMLLETKDAESYRIQINAFAAGMMATRLRELYEGNEYLKYTCQLVQSDYDDEDGDTSTGYYLNIVRVEKPPKATATVRPLEAMADALLAKKSAKPVTKKKTPKPKPELDDEIPF